MYTRNIAASAVLATAALLGNQAAQAAVSTQTQSFNVSSGPVGSGTSGSEQLTLVSGGLTATVNPFDSSLGVLNSFKITWDITHSASGMVGIEEGFSGGLSMSGGGSFLVNNVAYSGTGGSQSASGALGDSLNPSYQVVNTTTFRVSQVGLAYDRSILTLVTGASPFTLKFDENVTATYTRMVDLTGLVAGSVTLDYNYTPSAVPEAGSWLMFSAGLVALGAAGRRQKRRNAKPA